MQLLTHPLYLAPLPLYVQLYMADRLIIDADAPFVKQTFRNRTVIATENGTQTLTIPVVHQGRQAMRDVRISEHGNWRHLHRSAIASAYGSSPFYEYYADERALAHFGVLGEICVKKEHNLALVEHFCESKSHCACHYGNVVGGDHV